MRHVSKLLLAVSVCAWLASAAVAGETIAKTLGKKIDGYSLQDFRGKAHSLADLKDSKLVVVAFVGVECPLSKLYGPRLAEMAKAYEPKGVAFVAVDSNRQDAVTEMAQYAKTHQIEFPFLKDLNNLLADQMGARRNPQVFVLDADRKIRYAGRIDDQYGIQAGSGYAKFEINNTDLSNALEELLAGKDVSVASTDARGCLIGRVLKSSDEDSEVTYSNQIARIMQNHCVECHRPGQIGPFSLEKYDDVAGWAEMIDEVVREQRMPPWHPDPKYGHFRNDLSLAQARQGADQQVGRRRCARGRSERPARAEDLCRRVDDARRAGRGVLHERRAGGRAGRRHGRLSLLRGRSGLQGRQVGQGGRVHA